MEICGKRHEEIWKVLNFICAGIFEIRIYCQFYKHTKQDVGIIWKMMSYHKINQSETMIIIIIIIIQFSFENGTLYSNNRPTLKIKTLYKMKYNKAQVF